MAGNNQNAGVWPDADVYISTNMAAVIPAGPTTAFGVDWDLVGLLDGGFVPIHREAQRFADGVPAFHDSTHIVAADQADAMVGVLQHRRAALLVGHGIVIAEESVEHTCTAAIAYGRSHVGEGRNSRR